MWVAPSHGLGPYTENKGEGCKAESPSLCQHCLHPPWRNPLAMLGTHTCIQPAAVERCSNSLSHCFCQVFSYGNKRYQAHESNVSGLTVLYWNSSHYFSSPLPENHGKTILIFESSPSRVCSYFPSSSLFCEPSSYHYNAFKDLIQIQSHSEGPRERVFKI